MPLLVQSQVECHQSTKAFRNPPLPSIPIPLLSVYITLVLSCIAFLTTCKYCHCSLTPEPASDLSWSSFLSPQSLVVGRMNEERNWYFLLLFDPSGCFSSIPDLFSTKIQPACCLFFSNECIYFSWLPSEWMFILENLGGRPKSWKKVIEIPREN